MTVPNPPEEGPGEKSVQAFLDAGQAIIGATDPVSGAAIGFFRRLLSSPYQARRSAWEWTVSEALRRHDRDIADLLDDDRVVSVVMQATPVALKNHERAKIDSLRSLIWKTIDNPPDDLDLTSYFVSLIDSLSATQIRIVIYLDNPKRWFERMGQQPEFRRHARIDLYMEKALPELQGKLGMCEPLFLDLHSRGLITIPNASEVRDGDAALRRYTTPIGTLFVEYISHRFDD